MAPTAKPRAAKLACKTAAPATDDEAPDPLVPLGAADVDGFTYVVTNVMSSVAGFGAAGEPAIVSLAPAAGVTVAANGVVAPATPAEPVRVCVADQAISWSAFMV